MARVGLAEGVVSANIVLTVVPVVTRATDTAGPRAAIAAVWIWRDVRLTGTIILTLKTQTGVDEIFTVVPRATRGAGAAVVVTIVDRCAVSMATVILADIKLLRTVLSTVSWREGGEQEGGGEREGGRRRGRGGEWRMEGREETNM